MAKSKVSRILQRKVVNVTPTTGGQLLLEAPEGYRIVSVGAHPAEDGSYDNPHVAGFLPFNVAANGQFSQVMVLYTATANAELFTWLLVERSDEPDVQVNL